MVQVEQVVVVVVGHLAGPDLGHLLADEVLGDPVGRVLGGVQHRPQLPHEHPGEGVEGGVGERDKIFNCKRVNEMWRTG